MSITLTTTSLLGCASDAPAALTATTASLVTPLAEHGPLLLGTLATVVAVAARLVARYLCARSRALSRALSSRIHAAFIAQRGGRREARRVSGRDTVAARLVAHDLYDYAEDDTREFQPLSDAPGIPVTEPIWA